MALEAEVLEADRAVVRVGCIGCRVIVVVVVISVWNGIRERRDTEGGEEGQVFQSGLSVEELSPSTVPGPVVEMFGVVIDRVSTDLGLLPPRTAHRLRQL